MTPVEAKPIEPNLQACSWIQVLPVISTGHLTQETAQQGWSDRIEWATVGYGFFVKVDLDAKSLPEELVGVFQWAANNGYSWVRFDQDGDVIEGLPVFDW